MRSSVHALARVDVIAAFAVAASLVVGLTELPLVWDGSAFIFTTLNDQAPLLIFHRTLESILTSPLVLANLATSDIGFLRKVFSLTYAAVPTIALALSWFIVRRSRPDLFVWPVLGIALGLLPGRGLAVAESLIAAQLSWPMFLVAVVPADRRIVGLCLGLGAIVAVSHPVAVVLLPVVGVIGAIERMRRGSRRAAAGWLAAFATLTVMNFWLLTSRLDAYEVAVSQPAVLAYQFVKVAASPQIVGLELTALTALLVLRAGAQADGRQLYRRATVTAAMTLLPFAIWAAAASLWWDIIEYRAWALPVTLPFFLVAWIDARRRDGPQTEHVAPRMLISTVAAAVMLVTLTAQGLVWTDLVGRVERAVAAGHGCVPGESIDGYANSALQSWAVVPLSILVQGRTAHAFVAPANLCRSAAWPQEAPVPGLPPLRPHWFRFE